MSPARLGAGAGGGGRWPIPYSENTVLPRDVNGEACSPLVEVSPKRSGEEKLCRALNGYGRGGRRVGALSVSAPLKSWIAESGAVRESPAVGGIALPLGVLNGQDIFPRPSCLVRCTNGLPAGDAANQGER